ncbi:hypothetical protein KR200_002121, partial [Drosophila serrata]
TTQLDMNTCSLLVDKVTKWGLVFEGNSDALSFIEHLEERADTYRIERKYLSQALIVWTWKVRREFMEYFLPLRYYKRLDGEIRTRYQRNNEPFKEYLVDLRLQMQCAGFTAQQELERI